jgi:hypothetical protein
LTHGSRLVCSGLDNSCYDASSYIALQVSYFSEILNKYASIELKATILNSSPIDLVIGRDSIRKYNLFTEIPSQLVARPTMSKVTSLPVPACCKDSGSTCGCQPKGRSLLPDGQDPQRVSFPPREPTWQSPKHKASLEFSSTTLRIFSEERLPTSTKSTKRPRTRSSLGRIGSSTLTHSPRYMSSETRYSENKSSTYVRSFAIYSAMN